MASMMLALFSKFLYVFIVVSFILCGHIQYNMQMKKKNHARLEIKNPPMPYGTGGLCVHIELSFIETNDPTTAKAARPKISELLDMLTQDANRRPYTIPSPRPPRFPRTRSRLHHHDARQTTLWPLGIHAFRSRELHVLSGVDVLPCLKAWDSSINAMLLVRVSERLRPWQYSCLGCLTPCFHARPRPGRI